MGLVITEKDHLKKALCRINKQEYSCIIWIGEIYNHLIQDFIAGEKPKNNNWRKYGKHGWGITKEFPYQKSVEILKIYSKESNYELWD